MAMAIPAMDLVTRRAWKGELEKLDAIPFRGEGAAPKTGNALSSFEKLGKFISSRYRAVTAFLMNALVASTS